VKILVTGALGHIGSSLIRNPDLVEACEEISLVDNLSTQRYSSLFKLPEETNYRLYQGDVTAQVTAALVEGVDAVIHLAGVTEPAASVSDPNWLFDNNLRITKHVTDLCALSDTPLVFVSTTSVYTSLSAFVDESCAELAPISPYAQCKLMEESYVLHESGISAASIFRLGTIFGVSPGMRFHTAVNKFCWQAAWGQPIEVWSTAMDQLRPYLAVSDATRAITRTVLERIFPGEIINAVTCDATVRDVLTTIEAFGFSVNVRLVDSAVMNSLSFRTSTEKAASLGFEFKGDLEKDVFKTLSLLRGTQASVD
jgi:UDP-glucose 4-epimerase